MAAKKASGLQSKIQPKNRSSIDRQKNQLHPIADHPNRAFVIEVESLLRGLSEQLIVDIHAPYAIANPKISQIKPDTEIVVKGELRNTHAGISATGTVNYVFVTICSRCAKDLEFTETANFDGFYLHQHRAQDPEDQLYIENDTVDLFWPINDAVVLAIPYQPLCNPGCLGLCSRCGIDLNEHPDHFHSETIF
ncbi:MAG: DUF177 domain-containing protein [Bifidobacteriaceae bacterium]|jgi:uncharacterized protein|nr:DUF177 domain-containing protein [Bifidobacteriaceae bacterium]